jgi:hypothetical protein
MLRPGERVFWWKRITAMVEYPYSATILAVGKKRIKIAVDASDDSGNIVTRSVAADRLQPVGVYYAKATEQGPLDPGPTSSWGKLTRYLEVGEDLCALRHVDVFDNGSMLSYDRSHWVDNFGMLASRAMRKCRKEPWGQAVEIAPAEFEQTWEIARQSPTWREQVATACMSRMATLPIWLTVNRQRPLFD